MNNLKPQEGIIKQLTTEGPLVYNRETIIRIKNNIYKQYRRVNKTLNNKTLSTVKLEYCQTQRFELHRIYVGLLYLLILEDSKNTRVAQFLLNKGLVF